jgi:hypothetical protein
MINICTDPVDSIYFKNGHITSEEDLSINEIESVYELVSEKVFNEGVPESDENDESTLVKVFNVYFSIPTLVTINFSSIPQYIISHNSFYCKSVYSNTLEIISPPPKQV